MEETKVIYHIDDEDTPYLVKLPIAADKVTLADFKNVLNRPNYKFFFKSMDDDFGSVIRTVLLFSSSFAECWRRQLYSFFCYNAPLAYSFAQIGAIWKKDHRYFYFIPLRTLTPRTSHPHSVKTCTWYLKTDFGEVIFLFSIELLTILASCHKQSINDLDWVPTT